MHIYRYLYGLIDIHIESFCKQQSPLKKKKRKVKILKSTPSSNVQTLAHLLLVPHASQRQLVRPLLFLTCKLYFCCFTCTSH